MAAVVRIKNNRFVRMNLQNKNARYFSFKEIGKPGVLHGYIKGVVKTAYPLFSQHYYGKLRKMILSETKDDDDNDDDSLEFPLFTRGIVAEKCAEVKEGDYLLLENPFFELSHPHKPNLQISGDKRCSDICIWNINSKSRLLVGPDENGCENNDIETEDSMNHQESNQFDDMDVSTSYGDDAFSIDQASSSHIRKGDAKKLQKSPKTAKNDSSSGSTDVAKSVRLTRSSALKMNGQLQRVMQSTSARENDTKVTRSTSPRKNNASAEESSKESQDSFASRSERNLTSSASRKTIDNDNARTTRSTFLRRNRARAKESFQESEDSSATQSERNLTRSASRKTTDSDNARTMRSTSSRKNSASAKESSQESKDSSASSPGRLLTRSASRKTTDSSDTVSSPPRKRKRKFHLGPKGSSSSPSNSPELRNVVALEVRLKKTPLKEIQASKEQSCQNSSDEIGGSSRSSPLLKQHKVTSSSQSPKGAISTQSSQENEDKEVEKLMTNSQASTPSGTFSSKKQKCFGHRDSSPESPRKNLGPKSKKAVNASPMKTNKGQISTAAGSPGKINKDTRNPTQTNTEKRAVDTFVDDDKVPEKGSSPNSKEGQCAKHVVDESGKSTKDAVVAQPSVNELSTSTVTTSSSAPTTSTASSIVPSTSSTSSNVTSTSATSTNVQSTSANSTASTSTTSSSAPTTSTASSIVPSTSSTSSNVTSTSATSTASTSTTSSSAPTTSTTSNVPSQSSSYTVPATYTKISDVKLNTLCDLYGVAKFFKPPWKSKGTDMCSVVVLADPSTDEPLECVIFKDMILLPQIRRVGDIVRLHRMNIKRYKDKLQAVSTRGFSALVFDGNVNSPVTKEAARVNTASFSFVEAEKKVVQSLKEWHLSRPDLFEVAKFLTVSAVEPDVYFDIVCQVKGMAKHTNIDCVVLRVTDGTEPKYEIKSYQDDDFYQEVLASDSENQSPVFDVFLYGEHASQVVNLGVKAGTVLLLHNVHSIATQSGPGASLLDVLEPTLELCIHRGSEYGRGLAVLSPDSDDSLQLLQRLKQHGQTSPRKKS